MRRKVSVVRMRRMRSERWCRYFCCMFWRWVMALGVGLTWFDGRNHNCHARDQKQRSVTQTVSAWAPPFSPPLSITPSERERTQP